MTSPPINPGFGFNTGKGTWVPTGAVAALWQNVQGGAFWSGIIGTLGVEFRVVVAGALGQGGSDFLYDDVTALYDTATYSTGEVAFFDITPLVEDFSVSRGKANLGAKFNAGTASITLDNDSGIFNPLRGEAVIGNQVLRPGRIIAFQGKRTDAPEDAWKNLWLGRIDNLSDVYLDAAHRIQSVWACTDFFTLLQKDAPAPLEVADPATAGQLTGARLDYIWALEGFDTSFLDADAGTNTMQITNFPGSRLDQMQQAEAAEGGYLFVSRDGVITFRDQDFLNFLDPTPIDYIIGQDIAPLKILDVQTSWDNVRIVNMANLTAEGGVTQTNINTTSQALYGTRSVNLGGLQNDSDADVFDLCQIAVFRNAFDTLRVDSISVWASTIDSVDGLLEIEIGDIVQLQVNVAQPLGWDYTIRAFVLGVSHTVTAKDWKTTLRLDNADRTNPLLAGAFSLAYSTAYNRKET